MKNTPLHVGSLVRAELYKQDQTVSWLAQQLGIKRTNCYRILHAQSIHTSLMEQLSIAMRLPQRVVCRGHERVARVHRVCLRDLCRGESEQGVSCRADVRLLRRAPHERRILEALVHYFKRRRKLRVFHQIVVILIGYPA